MVGSGLTAQQMLAASALECNLELLGATLKQATFLPDLCLEGSVEVLTLKKQSLGVKCN